jgi:membrane fusion protein (multidrug efflux system)
MSVLTFHSALRPSRFFAPRTTAVAATALLLAACGGKKKEEAPQAAVPEVSVADVIQRDVPIGGELTGQLRGFEDIEIRARVEGYLKSVDYREGTEVKKGQLLFTIDDLPYRAKLAETKGDLARAQSYLAKTTLDVNRFKPLAAKRAISQAELDNAVAAQRSARAQVEAAKANVEKATLDVGYTRLTSPIVGLAGQAQRKVGDLVGKGDPTLLTTVSSIDPIRVSVNIPEALYLRYVSQIPGLGKAPPKPTPDRPGAQLVLGDGSIYPELGFIILIDRAVDPQTGTLRADLSFPNPKKILRPGLYAKVRFQEQLRPGALLVPQRAVNELQGQYSVVVVNAEGKAETRKVKVGPRVGSLWILDDGVKPGEKVIVEGALKVKDGMPVKATVVPAETAAPAPAAPAPGAPAPAAPPQAPGAPAPAAPGAGGAATGGAATGGAATGGAATGSAAPLPASTGSGAAPSEPGR